MEMSMEWYQRRAITHIIQGGGRIVRALDDDGIVYILDESFGYLYRQTYNIIPQWWKDSYQPS
jgi:Rad3-related DNA helicase